MPVSHYFLRRYFAPGFGELQKQSIPPLPPDARSFSVQQFMLGEAFTFSLEERTRVRAFNAIRRTLYALDEYELARENYDLIFESPAKMNAYLLALHHFEICVAESYQALELIADLINKPLPRREPEKGQDDMLWRFNRTYNIAKHTGGTINRQTFEEGDTLPVWITNEGLKSNKWLLKFGELHTILCELAGNGRVLSVWGKGMQRPELAAG